jgi:hypothetical protein
MDQALDHTPHQGDLIISQSRHHPVMQLYNWMHMVHSDKHKPLFDIEIEEVDMEPVKADPKIQDTFNNTPEGRARLLSQGWKAP